ncbi:hypothetical protein [Nocardiopsis changdeensis]|uniref:hypothetical protein n=1 Tax=Nocardiopsis changdeensis TaxID=2831969 RepID=UPI003F47115A
MTSAPDLTPLVSLLPALLFVLVEIALGVAAMAAAPRLAPDRRATAMVGGVLVAVGGLLTGGYQVLTLFAPTFPLAHTPVLGLLGAVPPLVFAGGALTLVLAVTKAPAHPAPHPYPRR